MNHVRLERPEELEAFFDHAPVGFSLLDADLRYIRINKALAEINGLPIEAHIGRHQHELVPEVDEVIAAAQRRVIETGEPSLGHRVRVETAAHPGLLREFEVDYFPIPDGERGNHLGCCVYESADSAPLLAALEQKSERSRALADNLNCFLAILTPEGAVKDVNAPALQVAGLELSDVQGKSFWDCYWWNYDEETSKAVRDAIDVARAGISQRIDLAPRIAGGGYCTVDTQFAPLICPDGSIPEIVVSGVDVTEQRKAERRRHIHNAELQHRMKNIFANIQSLTRVLASHSADLDDFREKFDHRIEALARTNDALMSHDWSDMPARDLIALELSLYIGGDRDIVQIEGPFCIVRSRDAPMINLAIHELATNAAKHGALSVEGGRVEIVLEADSKSVLSGITWREHGGPAFEDSERKGFGSILLERIVPNSLRKKATIERGAQGLTYRLH